MLIPAIAAEGAFLAAAMVWHAVAGHHAHYKLIQLFRPGLIAPPVRQDAGWHALPWWKRSLANGAVLLAALLTGLAWYLSPVIVIAAVALAALAGAVYAILRFVAFLFDRAPRVQGKFERSKS